MTRSFFFSFFLVALAATLVATGFYFRNALGWRVWELTHAAMPATALAPDDTALQLAIGDYFFGHGAYDLIQAERAYQTVLVFDAKNRDAQYQLARINFLRGNFPSAIEHIDRVLVLDPTFAKAYYIKGLILGYRGSLIEAINYFEQFIERAPDNWAGYNDLAWLHFQLGDYVQTLTVAEAGLIHSPENVWLLNMQGLALMHLDQRDGAREAFSRAKAQALQMQPQHWGKSYPGNDPAIYAEGLERMREAIDYNLELVHSSV